MIETCNVKATDLFGLLTEELWPPGHKFYDFIAYLKISIPLFPQQSLPGVEVGHLPSLIKGILNDQFFLACVFSVVHIGILDRVHAKELCFLVSMDHPFKINVHSFLVSLSIFSDLILQIVTCECCC